MGGFRHGISNVNAVQCELYTVRVHDKQYFIKSLEIIWLGQNVIWIASTNLYGVVNSSFPGNYQMAWILSYCFKDK